MSAETPSPAEVPPLPTETPLPVNANAPPHANAPHLANGPTLAHAPPLANTPPLANASQPANALPPVHTPQGANAPPPAVRPAKRGYHKLALLMTSQDDLAMFRRFTKLNMLNLMSLQAELMELENELSNNWDALELRDPETPYSLNFNLLRKKGESLIIRDKTSRNEEFLEPKDLPDLLSLTLLKTRTKLNEYSKEQLVLSLFSCVAVALNHIQMIHYFRLQRYSP
jgi:hypothetical protein